jgi:hypothetical protein
LPLTAVPYRSIRLERGAAPTVQPAFQPPPHPRYQSLLNIEDLVMTSGKRLPASDFGRYVTGPGKKRIQTLWSIGSTDLLWGEGYTTRRSIFPSLDSGRKHMSVYDAKSRALILDVDVVFQHFAYHLLDGLSYLLDSRYLILPATLHQEIIYVCDLQTSRQDEPLRDRPTKVQR